MVSQRSRRMEIKRRRSQIRNNLKNPLDIIENLWYNKYRKQNKKGINTMSEKITQRVGFTRAMEMYEQLGDAEMVDFFQKRLAQLDKRDSIERKPTARQMENEVYKNDVFNFMTKGQSYSANDILTNVPSIIASGMSLNRLSALLTQMVNENQITRTTEKRKNYYSLP